jgi:hypothetical protein
LKRKSLNLKLKKKKLESVVEEKKRESVVEEKKSEPLEEEKPEPKIGEKITEPKVEDKKPESAVLEEIKPESKIEEKKPEAKIEENIPEPKIEDKKPESAVLEDKKPEPKVEEEKPEPKVEDKNPEPKVDDKKPEPKVDDKKPEPKVEDKNPEPKVEEKKPEPKVDDKKPEPKVEDKNPEPKIVEIEPEPKIEDKKPESVVLEEKNPESKIEVKKPEPKIEEKMPEPKIVEKLPEPKIEEKKPESLVKDKKTEPKIEDIKSEPKVDDKNSESVVKDKKPEPKIEEKKSEPKVEDKKPESVVKDKKPEPKIEEKKSEPKVEEKKPELKIEEKKSEPKVEDKKPLLIVEVKKSKPKVEVEKPKPKVEHKKPKSVVKDEKPELKVEDKKPLLIVDEDIVIALNKTESINPMVVSQTAKEDVKILSNHTQSKFENLKTEPVGKKPTVVIKTTNFESNPTSKPTPKTTTHPEVPTKSDEKKPLSEEKKSATVEKNLQQEEIKPQPKSLPEKILVIEKLNNTISPESVVITQKPENITIMVNKTQTLPEKEDKIKVLEILNSFPEEPEKETNQPSINLIVEQSTQVKPEELLPKSEIKNKTFTPPKVENKTENFIPASEIFIDPINSKLKLENETQNEKSNITDVDEDQIVIPQLKSTKVYKPEPEVTKIKENNITISPEKPKHEKEKTKNLTLDEKETHIKFPMPYNNNKTIVKKNNSEINVEYVNKTNFIEEIFVKYENQSNSNLTLKYTSGAVPVKNKVKDEPKEDFVKIKVMNKNKNNQVEKVQLKTVKQHTSCTKDNLCIRCNKEMSCSKCKKNSYNNLIEGKCVCNKGYYYNKELKECSLCHPLCDVCSGGSSKDCLKCGENAVKLGVDSHLCVCKTGYKFDNIFEMCLKKSEILFIKHSKPRSCKGKNYWEPRISECTEPISNRTKELKFATVLYLGGNQSPEDLNESGLDILKQKWNGANDITAAGMRQNFISGLYFREKFINFYNLVGEKFNPDMVKVSASSKKAAIKGSYSFLLGLMPTLANVNDKEFFNPKLYVGKDHLIIEDTLSYSNITKKSKKKNNNNVNQVPGNTNKLNRTLSSSQKLNSTNVIGSDINKKSKMKSNRLQRDTGNTIEKILYSQTSSLMRKNSFTNNTVENTTQTYKKKKKGSMKAEIKKTQEAPEKKLQKLKSYTHEELDKIKKFDGKNPFQDDNDTDVLFEDIAPILPMVPSHTPIQAFSRDYGISDLSICKGAQEYIKRNTEMNRIKAEKIISKIQSKFNLHHYFKIPLKTIITPELMKNLTLAFFSNYNTNNKNITQMYIPKNIKALILEFNDLQIYGNLFGDKHNYIARAVLTPYAEQFLKNVNDEIDHEYKSIVKSMKKYYKHGKLDLNPLGEFKKLDFFFPDQQIFWAMMAFLSKLKGEQISIPLTPAGVSFELSKIKMNQFNLTEYLLNYNQFIYTGDKIAKKKSNQTMMSGGMNSEISNSAPALNRSISTNKDKKKKGKEKDSKDTKDIKDVKDSKNKKKNQEWEMNANFIINNNVNLMQDLNRKFRNPNLYSVKVYFNHELIFDQSYLAFRDKLLEFIVNKDELRDFCFPPKTDIWLMICIVLFACIVFQLLVVACLYTIKN